MSKPRVVILFNYSLSKTLFPFTVRSFGHPRIIKSERIRRGILAKFALTRLFGTLSANSERLPPELICSQKATRFVKLKVWIQSHRLTAFFVRIRTLQFSVTNFFPNIELPTPTPSFARFIAQF